MKTLVTHSYLKQQAKKLSRKEGIKLTKAYDEVVKHFGYTNYKNFLNDSKRRKQQAVISRKDSPTIPTKHTGRFKELHNEIFELLKQDYQTALEGLFKIIRENKDPFTRFQALSELVNNFNLSFNKIFPLLLYIPIEALHMFWPLLDLETKIQNKLLSYYLNDGQIEIDAFATHPFVEDLQIYGNLNYELTKGGIEISGSFELSTKLQYGSDGDQKRDLGSTVNHDFSGDFELFLNSEGEFIINSTNLDDSSFYN